MNKRLHAGALVGVTLAAAWPQSASAAAAGSLDTITELFKNGAAAWEGTLASYAMGLFGLLVAVEVTFTLIKLGLKGADMTEFGSELINRMMFVGFFSWLLTNSSTFARAIIDSLRQAGNVASSAGGGTAGIAPSDLFDAGVNMATAIFSSHVDLSMAGIGQFIALCIAGLIVCACFALIAAFMIVALVESYIVVSAGVILMGFGGSRWTKDFAVKTLTYAVSVGAKLFVMQLIAGLGESIVKSQAAALQTGTAVTSPADVLVLLGFGVVMLALVKTIPDAVQGLINGASVGNGGGLAAAGMVGAAAGAVAGGMAGGVAALMGASKLAGAQAAAGTGPGGLGGMMQNLGSAAAADVGARLGGRARGGSMGGRMGHQMQQQAGQLTQSMEKPMPPMSAGGGAEKAPAGGEGSIRGGGEGQAGGPADSPAAAAGATAAPDSPGGATAASGEGQGASAEGSAPSASAAAATGEGLSSAATDPVQGAGSQSGGEAPAPSASAASGQAQGQTVETPKGRGSDDGQIVSPGNSGIGGRLGGRGPKPGGGSA